MDADMMANCFQHAVKPQVRPAGKSDVVWQTAKRRQGAGALQDAGAKVGGAHAREASWSAAALRRFAARATNPAMNLSLSSGKESLFEHNWS
jgi:hypothetical protein